jgi:hypothetical protein
LRINTSSYPKALHSVFFVMPASTRLLRLPFGIVIRISEGVAVLERSALRREFLDPDDDPQAEQAAELAADCVESLLLALAAEGIPLESAAACRAIECAAEAIANNL